ncbi:HOG (high osmolarity glycerol) pathway protein [Curvularia kusanoi]|uniref:HOG (High osmolarity glycerol) pathway protein n=1 Tax=Curvularia kusanoi TaxID=90978 RepID=A0A9P4W888_CURKU|nr:HOG (high osmolarity glycerol) pathway protein [Curvularia kusanoi]
MTAPAPTSAPTAPTAHAHAHANVPAGQQQQQQPPDDIAEGFEVRGRKSQRPQPRQSHSAADMAADVLSLSHRGGEASSAGYLGSNRTSLPPLVTSPPSHAKLERAASYSNKRMSTMSTFSTSSNTPQPAPRSRPQSVAFPAFHSSLPYALVRDFAYEPEHPLYYGPLPQEHRSGASTPASEVSRRLSDPPPVAWRTDRGSRASGPQHLGLGEQLPMTAFGDGPPYSEDEDLASPVVTSHHSARHKKQKSNQVDFDQTRGRRGPEEHRRSSVTGVNGEGSYYPSHVNDAANGIGGEYITYPPSSSANLDVPEGEGASRRDSHFAAILPQRSYAHEEGPPYDSDEEMSEPGDGDYIQDDNRFSRDYQFTIASPDEEMHGKAVALFDFARENDNELPLVEGQVILVSYRHGQGWLVAQDPKTGESGLVPEEYVRLLRDIEGGWNGLMNGAVQAQEANHGLDSLLSPLSAGPEAKTPTQADHTSYTPVISTFSTSHKDLEPYPKDRLATPTNPEGGSFGKGREGGPMEGVETTPEPQSKPQNS